MHSIRTKFTLTVVSIIIIALSIATLIGVVSIKNLGRDDADQMIHLTATTGAMNLEQYFKSVEHTVRTVSTLVSDSFEGMPFEDLDAQVERARTLFGRIAYNTSGVLTYYFRIDPEVSKDVTGFWYVYQDGAGFTEHEVTDITQYDTNDTSAIVWFTVPKATGEGVWLPPYYTENLGARVVSYNVPVYWKDRFVGVIGIEIDYEMLKREVENISIFQSGYAFILDENENVFYHPMLDSAQLVLETTAVDGPELFISNNHVRYNYEGVEAEIDKLQNLDLSIVDRWIAQFKAHGEFYINSTDGELDHDSDEYKILAMQDIQSLMAAPLRSAATSSASSAWTIPVPTPIRC